MIEFEASIVIDASPEAVFRFVADRENYPQWVGAVSGAHVAIMSSGPFGEGTLIQEGPAVMKVLHVQGNRGFDLEVVHIGFLGRFLLRGGHTQFRFEPAGQGTKVTWKAQIESPVYLRLFDRPLSNRARQNVHAGLGQLKSLFEQKSG